MHVIYLYVATFLLMSLLPLSNNIMNTFMTSNCIYARMILHIQKLQKLNNIVVTACNCCLFAAKVPLAIIFLVYDNVINKQ